MATPEPGLAPGARLSHYEIVGKIGEGGMGAVYKATDVKLGRHVALKVISREFISPADRRRFAREANAASALNHPNIVTIHEYDSIDGVDFIAMEFIDGQGLDRVFAEAAAPLPVRLEYMRQVASALTAAHAAGIVHRDLKPANVMVTSTGQLKILDFGLAKREASENLSTEAGITRAGTVIGTPAYMSPEQALGEPIDWRSDIFSFGIMLYEAACGKRPFVGNNAMAVLHNIVNNNPDPPWKLNPALPDSLIALIEKCLAKNRDNRLATLADAVTELTTAITVTSDGVPATKRTVSTQRRLLLAGLALFALAGLAFAGRHAIHSWLIAGAPALVSPSAYTHYQSGVALLLRSDLKGNRERAKTEFEKAISADPSFAAAHAGLAEYHLLRNDPTPDPQSIRVARLSAQHAISITPDLAIAHVALARVSLAAGELDVAAREVARALELEPNSASAHRALGALSAARRDVPAAEAAYRKALTLAPDDWRISSELGGVLYRAARYREAASIWTDGSAKTPDSENLHRNLGAVLHMLGRHADAATELQKALALNPLPATYNNLGTIRFFLGQYDAAIAAFETAVDGRPNLYLYWANLGDARRWGTGTRASAPAAYSRAVQLIRIELQKRPDDLELRSRLALYLAKLGDAPAARAEIAAIAKPSSTAAVWFRLTVAWDLLGNREEALHSLDRALLAGYPRNEIENEPELAPMRMDRRYHRRMAVTPAY